MSSSQGRDAFSSQSNTDTTRPRSMAIQSLLNPTDYAPARLVSSISGDDDRSRGSLSPDSEEENQFRQTLPDEDQRRLSSSSSSPSARERREFRPTYLQEEEYFIWYHRVDLGMDWPDVKQAYNAQFPQRQRRGFQGIQCKYYRCCETYGVPRVRDRNRAASPAESYGVRSRLPGLWYPWMRDSRQQPGTTCALECKLC